MSLNRDPCAQLGSFVAFNTYVSLYENGFSALANIYLNLTETLIAISRRRDCAEIASRLRRGCEPVADRHAQVSRAAAARALHPV